MNVRRLFGYKIIGGDLIPDEATAPIVREIFQRAVNGESFGAIARDLNDRGITGVNGANGSRGASVIYSQMKNTVGTLFCKRNIVTTI